MSRYSRGRLATTGRLVGMLRGMLPMLALAIVLGIIGHLCAIAISVCGGYALLHVLGIPAPFDRGLIMVLMPVLAVARSLLSYTGQSCNHYIAFKMLATIRDQVFGALRQLAPAKLETRDKGDMISLITSDVELLQVFYAHTVAPAIVAVAVSVAMVALLASYHILLGLVGLCGYAAVGIAIPRYIARSGEGAGEGLRESSGRLSNTVLEGMRGLRDILQFNQGGKRLEAIGRQSAEVSGWQSRLSLFEGISSALSGGMVTAYAMLVLFCGAGLFYTGSVGFDGMLLPFIAVLASFGPVMAFAGQSGNLISVFAAAGRILDILDEEPQVDDVHDGHDVGFHGMRCQDVGFAYGREQILRGFSMDVPAHSIVGIHGRSGSGKSTLLRLMMRFWDVDRGSISMSGMDIRRINTHCLRANQALVSQDTVLFNESIEDNVRIASPRASHQQVEQACKKTAIHDFIMSLPDGYATGVGELGDRLSGGERQRIGLARAFLHNAPMLLLDEPTANLDSLNEGEILKALQQERAGRTIVLVSHRQSALGMADRVVEIGRR